MDIKIERTEFRDLSTHGKLYVNGNYICETLEDTDRHLETNPTAKVWGKTAIPRGKYNLSTRMSPHFGREMFWLTDVPEFSDVYIHKGNSPEDTDGCILVVTSHKDDYGYQSAVAFDKLSPLIEKALKDNESIVVEVV